MDGGYTLNRLKEDIQTLQDPVLPNATPGPSCPADSIVLFIGRKYSPIVG